MRITHIVDSVWFKEYLELIESINRNSVNTLKPMITRTGSKNGGTWVHLKLMIRVAIQMDAVFADEVIETFITGKLLEHRDLAGDNYRSLAASAAVFPNVNYPQLAKALNWNVFDRHVKGIRQTAIPEQIEELHKLEEQLSFAVDMGYIKTFYQLIEYLVA